MKLTLTKAKWTAIRWTLEAIVGFVVIVFVVVRYEDELQKINWRLVALLCIGAGAIFAFYRWQSREDNKYDVLDMFMKDGKADIQAHLIVVFAGLAIWVIVQQALAKAPVTELVLGVLTIFVGGKALGGFSEAMKSRGPPVDQSQNVNVLPGAKIQAAGAPAAPSEEVSQYHG